MFLLEEQILGFLQDWLTNYKVSYSSVAFAPLQERLTDKEALLQKVESDINMYKKQMNKSYDLLERGIYTIEIFQQRQETLTHTIAQLEESKENLLKDIAGITKLHTEQTMYLPKIKHLLETYKTNSPEINNRILKELLDKVYYEKNEPNRKGQLYNCNFTLEIYPRIPK